MTATGNTFDRSSVPLVSASDYAGIESGSVASSFGLPVQDYPDGWTDPGSLAAGTSDFVTWSAQPCINVVTPKDSYVAIAVRLKFSGSPTVPIG